MISVSVDPHVLECEASLLGDQCGGLNSLVPPSELDDDYYYALPVTGCRTMAPSEAEQACFEAGIKFGSLYHQFAGTPVSPESAASLERAIEQAIQNQPYCSNVTVDILTENLDVTHGYTELSGRHMEVTIDVAYDGIVVRASMSLEDGYPRMRIDEISD